MNIWVMIGWVFVILMIAGAIRFFIQSLKATQTEQPIQATDFVIEEQSQQPIIPRHLRQQTAEVQTQELEQPVVAEPIVEKKVDVVAAQEEKQPVQVEPIPVKIENTEIPKEKVEPQPLPSQQDTINDESKVSLEPDQTATPQATTVSPEKVEEKPISSLNDLATVEIEAWQGESDVLDAHLSEQDRNDEESALATAEQIVALYMYPNPARALSGERTLKMMLKYGLRFGEMSCFHRYENPEQSSPLMFSVLRINEDGTPTGFDLESLPNEEVKGLAFFLALPNTNAVQGFDMMASIAGLMARDTEGLVFDEQSLELTPQLRDHWRYFVIEYRSGQIMD